MVVRAAVAGAVGVVVAVVVGVAAAWRYAPAAGWTAVAAVLVGWTWLLIAHMSAEQTEAHAAREDPARALTGLIALIASVASLAGVVYLLAAGSGAHGAGEAAGAGLGILSVAGAWAVVHTVFPLRYECGAGAGPQVRGRGRLVASRRMTRTATLSSGVSYQPVVT